MRNSIPRGLVVTLAASLFGCAQADATDILELEDEPTLETRGGGEHGSGGSNGLHAGIYFDYEGLLIDATFSRLLVPGTSQIEDKIGNSLLRSEDGRTVFHYAAACAVPPNKIVEWSGYQFEGLGHLATGASWMEERLEPKAIEDLLACVVAHMNNKSGVPILLSGPNVRFDGLDHSDFWVDEARWAVHLGTPGNTLYFVWPNPLFEPPACVLSGDPMEALKERFCGQNPDDCRLLQGEEKECRREEEGWFCAGRPAIMTTLREKDVPHMYCF